jgi:predicted ester cyclase
MVAAFSTGDVTLVGRFVGRDFIDHQGLGGEAMRGPDGFREVVATARDGHVELAVTIEDLIEGSDRAAARLRWRGMRPAGGFVDRESIEIVRVEHGHAVEHWGGRS